MFPKARSSAVFGSFLLVCACSGGPEPSRDSSQTGGTPFGVGGAGAAPGTVSSAGGATNVAVTNGGTSFGGMSAGGIPVGAMAGGPPGTSGGSPPSAGGALGAGGISGTRGGSGSGGASPSDTGGAAGAVGGSLPPVTSVDQDGPYTVTIDQNAGANSWVFRPTELGKDGVKHPIFVWGTGATSVPSQYTDHFNRVASHGFVVISPNSASVSASLLEASLDWILAQNDDPSSLYYQKLDVAKVAMGGHSLGSLATFDAEATETRLTTTIHIAGGSFDGTGSSKVKTPTAYICGASGDIALPNCQRDFQNVESQPTFYSELQGIDHIGAARAALPGMVAWLRWHLAGEVDRKAMFTGPSGEFFTGMWTSQTKNW
jgi:hypothetical protein